MFTLLLHAIYSTTLLITLVNFWISLCILFRNKKFLSWTTDMSSCGLAVWTKQYKPGGQWFTRQSLCGSSFSQTQQLFQNGATVAGVASRGSRSVINILLVKSVYREKKSSGICRQCMARVSWRHDIPWSHSMMWVPYWLHIYHIFFTPTNFSLVLRAWLQAQGTQFFIRRFDVTAVWNKCMIVAFQTALINIYCREGSGMDIGLYKIEWEEIIMIMYDELE